MHPNKTQKCLEKPSPAFAHLVRDMCSVHGWCMSSSPFVKPKKKKSVKEPFVWQSEPEGKKKFIKYVFLLVKQHNKTRESLHFLSTVVWPLFPWIWKKKFRSRKHDPCLKSSTPSLWYLGTRICLVYSHPKDTKLILIPDTTLILGRVQV